MKNKILNLVLVLTSLIGYLEWSGGNNMFIYEIELDLLSKLIKDPLSVLHPFTILPLVGQILLIITLFQKTPSRILTYIGMGGIAILFLLMFAIGVMNEDFKILGSTLPFLITAIIVVIYNRRLRKAAKN